MWPLPGFNFKRDWINHGEMLYRDVHEIPLAEDDPARRQVSSE